MKDINHPNVVKCHNYFKYKGHCVLVMEYCNGLTLKQHLRS
jgi:serine/threonine protein kinase